MLSLVLLLSPARGQFKYSVGLGAGITYPDYSRFNDTIVDSGLSKVGPQWLPLAYSFSYRFYPSLRVGYFRLSNALIPEKSSGNFALSMKMQGISVETFFTFLGRFEANFGIAPLLGRAEFYQDLKAESEEFQFSAETRAGVKNGSFAFYTWTGIRIYLGNLLALEGHLGYLRGKFKGDSWKNGEASFGTIDLTQPAFKFGMVAGW